MPLAQDRSLDLLASSPARYHCTTDASREEERCVCVCVCVCVFVSVAISVCVVTEAIYFYYSGCILKKKETKLNDTYHDYRHMCHVNIWSDGMKMR